MTDLHTEDQMLPVTYQPPTIRISATYFNPAAGSPESVEIEINADSVEDVDAGAVLDIIRSLFRGGPDVDPEVSVTYSQTDTTLAADKVRQLVQTDAGNVVRAGA